MTGSKRTLRRGFGTGQVPAQPHAHTGGSRNGTGDSGLDHAEGVRQCIRELQQGADTIVQAAPDHPVRGSRNMKGLQPFACI
jgi:hypothetical protein